MWKVTQHRLFTTVRTSHLKHTQTISTGFQISSYSALRSQRPRR